MASLNGPYIEEDYGASDYGGRQYIVVDNTGNYVLEFKNGHAAPLIERDMAVAVQIATDLSADDTEYLKQLKFHYLGSFSGDRKAAVTNLLSAIAALEAASFGADPAVVAAVAKMRLVLLFL